ncbi:hypothetical protein [Thalassotalea sp. G2M2-11]|uniref:hypothetical protein n=1 Tax=Thalassotalea sp. G2M2-11 TaxID=2787627 RepID=UPI0019D10A8C|nr:hypothetical protein [Thalassotalea sp. G2M2-11]
MIRWLILFLIIYQQNTTLLANEISHDEIRVVGQQSKEDLGHEYFTQLIKLAINASTPEYQHKSISILKLTHTTQGRTVNLLERGVLDVIWTGTNQARESQFIPIRIPLFMGLLGYRVSLIHQDNYSQFAALLDSPEKLKSLTACQGEHWPDSDILEDNGFNISRIVNLSSMFKILAYKRCDYFPRAIFEGYSELDIVKKEFPNLVMFDDLVLHYPFAIYFFVNKNKPELAQQIEYGLRELIKDGRFFKLMKKHPFSAQIFPLEKWKNKKFLHLRNSELTEKTMLDNPKLWLKLYE